MEFLEIFSPENVFYGIIVVKNVLYILTGISFFALIPLGIFALLR